MRVNGRATPTVVVTFAALALSCGARDGFSVGGLGDQRLNPGDGAGDEAACEAPEIADTLTRFAIIGDYGDDGPGEAAVAALVRSFDPDFVVTAGDNNYPYGEAATIDTNIGKHYAAFICPYRGAYGPGGRANRFFPAPGNHDWYTPGLAPYLDYFELPGNERYYDVVWGSVHLFALDSDENEPDGIDATSAQAAWLEARLEASSARWHVVAMHHPPYSSGWHGSSPVLRWPFAEWGVDLVVAGHDHHYERLEIDGVTYIVNGLGGRSLYTVGEPLPGSAVHYTGAFGAQLVEATPTRLVSRFYTVDGALIDEWALGE